ncbi:MAG: N-acetyltransferase [Methylobacterium mesophilicum]|nr:N-acetyltransferase [Methylobacterium mesophilicum]
MTPETYRSLEAEAAPGAPLLVLCHGTGGGPREMLELGRALLPGAAMAAPAGDVLEGGAARFFRRTGEGVYDMDDLARASAKMTGFIEAQKARRGASAVIGLGYSNGANILASSFFLKPALFDALVLLHPLIPHAPEWGGTAAGRKVLVTAGERDPICPPALTHRFLSWLEAAGVALATEWHGGGHELRQSEIDAASRFLAPFAAVGEAEILREESGGRGRYRMAAGSGQWAELTYGRGPAGEMVIDHTFVPPLARGMGLAETLTRRAVADAKAEGRKVVPLCAYVAAQFRRHPEWRDLLRD